MRRDRGHKKMHEAGNPDSHVLHHCCMSPSTLPMATWEVVVEQLTESKREERFTDRVTQYVGASQK